MTIIDKYIVVSCKRQMEFDEQTQCGRQRA